MDLKQLLESGLSVMGLTPPPGATEALCRYGSYLLEQNQVMNLWGGILIKMQ